ncbi:MAG: PHP domain-containing protein, partial [Pseudomonadota bacterium]|nr:PHP domain-containing protein [Pseudomonadota bacterium]
MPRYAELHCVTNFSFLRGGSHGEELVARAKALGLDALAVTDANTVAGVVRAHLAAKAQGLQFIPAARLDPRDAPSLLAYPTDRAAWGRLTRLLTLGQRRAGKGDCELYLDDIAAHPGGLIFIAVLDGRTIPPSGGQALARIRHALPGAPLHLAASHLYRSDDRARIAALAALARETGIPLVATGDVLYHAPERRPLQDVLTCIREGCTIHQAGLKLEANAERHLKDAAEMARLFEGHEEALERSIDIAGSCRFSLDELVYEYPDEPVPPGRTPQGQLEEITWQSASWRFPQGIPDHVAVTLRRELQLIADLDYAPYFLTVHDIVQFARSCGILCQGRGSAANSAVCYCLGITNVDPTEIDLLFERFVS